MKEAYKFSVKHEDKELNFSFKQPSRNISREGEMLYAKVYADCLRGGLLTNAEALSICQKRGGVFNEEEAAEYTGLLGKFVEVDKKIKDAKEKGEPFKDLEDDMGLIKAKIGIFQSKQEAIYELTAETKSRDAMLLHYALSLTYTEDKPYFVGKNYEERVAFAESQKGSVTDEVLKRSMWFATASLYSVPESEANYPSDEKSLDKKEDASISPEQPNS